MTSEKIVARTVGAQPSKMQKATSFMNAGLKLRGYDP